MSNTIVFDQMIQTYISITRPLYLMLHINI